MYQECEDESALKLPYLLTIRQACAVYGIGERSLRRFVANNPTAPFICSVGNRVKIKKKQFEEFLDSTDVI